MRRALVGLVVLVAMLVLLASPARAHDELVDSVPDADSAVASAPERVELRFNGTPLEIGATVIVADHEGTDWAAGPAVVSESVVGVPLESGMPDGHYQARWRIVSGDGAVVSGHFDFAVGDVAGAPEVALPEAVAPTTTVPEGAGAGDFDLRSADPSGDDRTDGPGRRLVVAGVGAAGALAMVGLYRAIDRPSNHRRIDPDPPPPNAPEEP